MTISLFKARQRVADHGEVFTPSWMVDAVLDLVRCETHASTPFSWSRALREWRASCAIVQRKLAAVKLEFGKFDVDKPHYAPLGFMCLCRLIQWD